MVLQNNFVAHPDRAKKSRERRKAYIGMPDFYLAAGDECIIRNFHGCRKHQRVFHSSYGYGCLDFELRQAAFKAIRSDMNLWKLLRPQ
jgi:hypothetical protein